MTLALSGTNVNVSVKVRGPASGMIGSGLNYHKWHGCFSSHACTLQWNCIRENTIGMDEYNSVT